MRLLQSLLQRAFLRAEGVFNAAFGDRLNPLYHLGAITFFLFWVVAASGLYLYAFFETGVAAAHASVEALTHRQWFAGGVLRSVHRYASDAMVVTMLLHLLRHFAFDRFRGYRWFSWLTGVVLVWLVYVSGINGYMLPWDQLALWAVTVGTNMMGYTPVFGSQVRFALLGGAEIGTNTLLRWYVLHVLMLPFVIVIFMAIHFWRVRKDGGISGPL